MVEIKLDLNPGSLEPSLNHDCFVSVRLGEQQKLSRLASSRTYRFPKSSDNNQGRIEVYRRVGFAPIHVDPLNNGATDVTCKIGNETLSFSVDVCSDDGTKEKARQAQKLTGTGTSKMNEKTVKAKEYLQQYCIEACLSEAMQSLLQDRPENPTEYLANKLLSVKLPSPKAPKPKPATTTVAPANKALMPFKSYYRDNFPTMGAPGFSNIFAKFPAKLGAEARATACSDASKKALMAEELTKACHDGRLDQALEANKIPKAAVPFVLKPSVGTWMAVKPFDAALAAAYENQRELAATGPKKKWAQLPSAGTWVQALPFKETSGEAANFDAKSKFKVLGKTVAAASKWGAVGKEASSPATQTEAGGRGNGVMVVPAHQIFGNNFIGGGLRFI
jgi:hypothetical protein